MGSSFSLLVIASKTFDNSITGFLNHIWRKQERRRSGFLAFGRCIKREMPLKKESPAKKDAPKGESPPVWGYNPMKDDRSDFTQSRLPRGDMHAQTQTGCPPSGAGKPA